MIFNYIHTIKVVTLYNTSGMSDKWLSFTSRRTRGQFPNSSGNPASKLFFTSKTCKFDRFLKIRMERMEIKTKSQEIIPYRTRQGI